ncbi:hypothetical protein C8Q76DRAFT_576239, partial [Earliella scabrosa]
MISKFVEIVLRYGRPGKGLFGKCTGYYGTVEAQGRGTLHCHMLIWLEGHPSPQKLRDLMSEHQQIEYKQSMFTWLESIIKSELIGTTEVVNELNGHPLPPPEREPGSIHPGTVAAPSITAFSNFADFQIACDTFVNDLVKAYNWHKHKATCFKYTTPGSVPKQPKDQDEQCRMRIDGSVRPHTVLDTETGSILLRRFHPRIANFNDLVIFLMKSNMDIKFIGSGEAAKALIYYITDYITKASVSTHIGLGALTYAIKKTNEQLPHMQDDGERVSRTALTATLNRMMSRQEISHQQVMSYLVGGGDYYTSHTFKFLHWRSFDR